MSCFLPRTKDKGQKEFQISNFRFQIGDEENKGAIDDEHEKYKERDVDVMEGEVDIGRAVLEELQWAETQAELERQRRAELARQLAEHVRTAFREAATQRTTTATPGQRSLKDRLLLCQRLNEGRYDEQKLAEIRKARQSEAYDNIVAPKSQDLIGWMTKVMGGKRERPFALEPSPMPDLPPMEALGSAALEEDFDAMVAAAREEAETRAKRMQRKIEDQFDEGGFDDALAGFLNNYAVYPYAVLRAPVVRPSKRYVWRQYQGGKLVRDFLLGIKNVNPFDFYKEPNAADVQDGYTLELAADISRRDLEAMRGQPGWNDEEIEAALAEPAPISERSYLDDEAARAQGEGRDPMFNAGITRNSFCGIWMHDDIEGQVLQNWGAQWAEEAQEWYPTVALLIGQHVVYAMENPDPLGLKPYFADSFRAVPGSWCGRGLPEILEEKQDAYNACERALRMNVAFAARATPVVDLSVVEPGFNAETDIQPGLPILHRSNRITNPSATQKPVDWLITPAQVATFQNAKEAIAREADNITLIPRFVHGAGEGLTGGAATKGGLLALMEAAADGVRYALASVDRKVLRPLVESFNRFNIRYLPDEIYAALKGDFRAVARGVMSLLIQESADQRLAELTQQAAATPAILQRIGMDGLGKMLRQVYERNNLPDILPSETTMEQIAAGQEAMGNAEFGMRNAELGMGNGGPGEAGTTNGRPAEAGNGEINAA